MIGVHLSLGVLLHGDRKDMVYTSTYIKWDGLGPGYGMGSRIDTIF